MKLFLFLLVATIPTNVLACSITWNSPEKNVRNAMQVGIDKYKGWSFKRYDEVCKRLNRNGAKLHVSGQFWEESPNSFIYSYSLSIADKKSSLTSQNFIRRGLSFIKRKNIKDVYLHFFLQINQMIDVWHDEGIFDQSIKYFHQSKKTLRNK